MENNLMTQPSQFSWELYKWQFGKVVIMQLISSLLFIWYLFSVSSFFALVYSHQWNLFYCVVRYWTFAVQLIILNRTFPFLCAKWLKRAKLNVCLTWRKSSKYIIKMKCSACVSIDIVWIVSYCWSSKSFTFCGSLLIHAYNQQPTN